MKEDGAVGETAELFGDFGAEPGSASGGHDYVDDTRRCHISGGYGLLPWFAGWYGKVSKFRPYGKG